MRAATDVGGTFTDLVYYEVDPATGRSGQVKIAKVDTTPPNFEEGVVGALAKASIAPAKLDFFAHGATVVINALTERKGVRTALITTAGFRDVLEIARGNRPDLFNFAFHKPKPFVERHLRAEVVERTNYKGEIERPADLTGLPELVLKFKREGVQAIAVVFLHSYINPQNEQAVVQRLRELWPEVSILASHAVSREWREYERTSTTVLSAYVHPIAERYIGTLEAKLAEQGFTGKPYMMQSNGGITTARAAKANPITMVESGPASGIFAAAYVGKAIGANNLIVLDIGGTTAKCTLIEEGHVKVTTEYYIERDGKNPGYPIQTPVSDIVEIGNGGGSIAWVDAGGKLHVGPHSAAARPGPAAYGRGGAKATTTDANLVLGRIDPASFVGGEREPDWKSVEAAFAPLQAALGMSREEVARGIIRIANANMTRALRLVSTNRGYDPRDFTLMAFGGGGAMHALALAEELKVPHVVIPVNSSVFSAWGMLLTDLRRDYLQTRMAPLGPSAVPVMQQIFGELEGEALKDYSDENETLTRDDIGFEYLVDMRYAGQQHTVKVPCIGAGDGEIDLEATANAFHGAHQKRFTYRLDTGIELVNFHLIAKRTVPKPPLAPKPVTGLRLEAAIKGARRVDYDVHGVHDATIYDGLRLEPGMHFVGPAVIQEPSVTCVVPPGHRVSIDQFGNYHIHLSFDGEA
ncbi:5-oxoprolinase (ATP-hydrolyzing) [Phenylobacterium zucineum HLK1]|uniref:5-oxoprolinase (ATP-hydrolyzing) n=1 Tax=Phenylobacterium zucineum (strain HLK1) TaxID=450851 RepID=B4RGE0_PHEZH|nr:hydantoinase/oxoprolinase family protein [Phenylobacterium zucineum]ACG78846.1 5-oxoprolinase (ATP-hydrolyzing) [Phenylobacterium zucineum HLK1]